MNPPHWPWPSDTRKLWASKWDQGKGYNVSVRNDALWRELEASRTTGEVAAARAWLEALRADGWTVVPTYSHEPVEQAFSAMCSGFKVMGIARTGIPDKEMPSGSINAWCDRGISLSPLPIVYPGWEAIRALSRRCPECGAEDVPTVRVAFANRCCIVCQPELQRKLETPGWCD